MKSTTRLAALAAISLLVAACGGGGASDAPTQAVASTSATQAAPTVDATPVTIEAPTDLITAGTLTDCVDIEYPPMEYFPSADVTDPNQAVGFDVDAAKAVADRLGLDARDPEHRLRLALIPDLQAGRCDIVWSALYVYETRLEVADAVPYMATGQVVMVATGNAAGITAGERSLRQDGLDPGRRARRGARRGGERACDDGRQRSDRHPGATERSRKSSSRSSSAASTRSGRPTPPSRTSCSSTPNEYEVAYALPRDDNYGVYYGKGKTDVGDALQAAIDALKADGTLATIAQTYAMDPTILDVIE